jgi:hypothetical protein
MDTTIIACRCYYSSNGSLKKYFELNTVVLIAITTYKSRKKIEI